jgi:zinc transporter ZupT
MEQSMGICLVLLPILYMTVTGINRRSGEVLMSNDTVNNFAKVYPANLEGGVACAGARSRKRSTGAATGASLAIAIGSLLDGIPESAAIGISLLDGEGVALVTMFAIFISNVPEGLSSSIGMKAAGKSATGPARLLPPVSYLPSHLATSSDQTIRT